MCVNLENIKRNGEKKMNMTKEKTLSVVIPCYNEKDNIVSLVKKSVRVTNREQRNNCCR